MDLYLKAADALELYAYLESAGIVARGEEGPYVAEPHKYALDVIGTIYKPTGKTLHTDEGEVPEMAAIDGYHANLRVIHAEDAAQTAENLAQIVIEPPGEPVRGWF